jgi:hypothetical protein
MLTTRQNATLASLLTGLFVAMSAIVYAAWFASAHMHDAPAVPPTHLVVPTARPTSTPSAVVNA